MKLRKSDRLWETFCRIEHISDGIINKSSPEYDKLNKIGWEVIDKYIEAIMKEFLK